MRKFTIAAIAVLSIAGSGAVYAQYHRPWMEHVRHMRMNPRTAPPSSTRGSPPSMPG